MFSRFLVTLVLTLNGTTLLADDELDLKPAEGNVTWRLTYLADAKAPKHAKPPRREHREVTVPFDVVDAHGTVKVEFADLRCDVMYGVDMAKICVYTGDDKLLYERLYQGPPKNLIGDGFTGENTVYHPKSGSRVKFSAFAGPGEAAAAIPAAKLTAKPRAKLSDFTDEQINAANANRNYATWANARTILVARLSVRDLMVMESLPPSYDYQLQVTRKQVLAGAQLARKTFNARYGVSGGRRPRFAAGTDYLVAVSSRGDLALVLPATDEAADTACIAYLQRHSQQANLLEIARTQPAKHPLHGVLKAADGVAVIHIDPTSDAAVAFDLATQLTTTAYVVDDVMHGDLKAGSATLSLTEAAAQAVNEPNSAYLVTYTALVKGWKVDHAVKADETSLRVAAAVFRLRYEAISGLAKVQRQARPRRAAQEDLEEPAEGFSPPSPPGF